MTAVHSKTRLLEWYSLIDPLLTYHQPQAPKMMHLYIKCCSLALFYFGMLFPQMQHYQQQQKEKPKHENEDEDIMVMQ